MERKKQKMLGLMANICLVMIFFGKGSLGDRMERPPGVLLTGMTNTRQGFLLF